MKTSFTGKLLAAAGITGGVTAVGITPMGVALLFAWGFAESSFFPPPTETVLIPLCFKHTMAEAMILAAIGMVSSVLGAAFGYFIGIKGGRPLAVRMFGEKKVGNVDTLMQKYDVWAIAIAAFTPVPYKVFTILGGVCRIHFWRFILVSVLARGTRYAIIAALTAKLSANMDLDDIKHFINGPKFAIGTCIVFAVLVVGYIVYKKMKKPAAQAA